MRKRTIHHALTLAVALALLIAAVLLPGLPGLGLALGATALAAWTLRALIREDKQYGRDKDAGG